MTRIYLSGLFLVALFGTWAQAQRQEDSYTKRNTNNVRLVNKDFNAYHEAESVFSPFSVPSDVPGEAEISQPGNEPREIGGGERNRNEYDPRDQPYKPSPARPYWEERTYEFQFGEPKIYRESTDIRPYNRIDSRIDNFAPVKEEVQDLDIFGWAKFQDKETKGQQVQNLQNSPIVQQDIEFLDAPRPEPCTVTEVLTTTYYVKPRPVVTEYTVSTVLLECPPSPTPPPTYYEPYYVPCDICEYPQNCDHCPPRPRLTKVPIYTIPIHKIPCDKCQYPDNCDHCPLRLPEPRPKPIYNPEPYPLMPCEVCLHPDNCDHCPKPQPYPAPCDLCHKPQNCDHCFRPQPYPSPCEICAHPQNCDHCPNAPPRPETTPCEICRHPDQCDHCPEHKLYMQAKEREERYVPKIVTQPKRHPQVGPQVINGEAEGDKWEKEEQELQW